MIAVFAFLLAAIPSMSRLQVGKPVLGTQRPALLFDGAYRYAGAWGDDGSFNPALVAGDWAAVDLGAGAATKLLLVLSNESQSSDLADSAPTRPVAAYHIDGAASTTTGQDGAWTRLVTVSGNPYKYREHLVSFAGLRWLRFTVDVAGAIVDELDAWNASTSNDDTWVLLGDSITSRCASFRYNIDPLNYDVWPSFGEYTRTTRGQYPAQIGAGFLGQGAAFLRLGDPGAGRGGISQWLTDFPDVRHWAVSIGTNDAATIRTAPNLANWLTDMRAVSAALRSAGRVPILARIPYSVDPLYGGGAYGTDDTAYLNANGVDVLVAEGSFRAGPDLYTYFGTHQTELTGYGGDGTHPTLTGCQSWNRLWSAAVQPLY
jgi:lysophospholipase L1-like esterase